MDRFELLIVGDELLTGKRRDSHLTAVIERLRVRALALSQAHLVGDDEAAIAGQIEAARGRGAILLCCGGIGATPDDRTRQAAARAFGRPLQAHAEAVRRIEQRYGERAYPQRIRMAEFPQGAQLIPNPVNQVAGFSVEHCHFVPGFPEMAWPMIEWVLDTHYRDLQGRAPMRESRLRVSGTAGEGEFVALMEACMQRFGGVSISSLPSRAAPPLPGHIEFGFRGERADEACAWFAGAAAAMAGVTVERLEDY